MKESFKNTILAVAVGRVTCLWINLKLKSIFLNLITIHLYSYTSSEYRSEYIISSEFCIIINILEIGIPFIPFLF